MAYKGRMQAVDEMQMTPGGNLGLLILIIAAIGLLVIAVQPLL